MFTCSRCKQSLADEMFYTSGGRRSGYCRACQKEYITERRRTTERARNKARQRTYGLTPEGHAALLQRQNGVCAICGQPPRQPRGEEWKPDPVLVVDHDHLTGLVRGLLCTPCNILLGRVKDDAEWMERAAAYLRSGAIEVIHATRDVQAQACPVVVLPVPEPEPEPEFIEAWAPSPEELAPITRCVEADALPSDGDQTRPTSNFQKRRKEQIEALQRAYTHFWKGQVLSAEMAKELLRLAHDCAEEVYEAFERNSFRKLEYPAAYVRKAMMAEPKQEGVAAAAIGPTRRHTTDPDELPPATPEQRDRWRRAEQVFLKKGILPADGGDRW